VAGRSLAPAFRSQMPHEVFAHNLTTIVTLTA
jgi:hypothetical protein